MVPSSDTDTANGGSASLVAQLAGALDTAAQNPNGAGVAAQLAGATTAAPAVPTRTLWQQLEDSSRNAIQGALASLAAGGDPSAAAATLHKETQQTAAMVFTENLASALAPLRNRIDAAEASAGDWISSHPIIHELTSILARFFPHEVDGLKAMLTPPAPPAPPAA